MRYLIEKWIAIVLPVTIALMSLQGCSDDEPVPAPSPADDAYVGNLREISIVEALDDFHQAIFKCAIQAPDGTVITRTGVHQRIEGCARLTLDRGLCAGTYRLLYLLTPEVEGNDTIWVEYGLGCRVKLDADGAEVLDTYNSFYDLFGSGTDEDPFIISSSEGLKRLRNITNDGRTNPKLTPSTYFSQVTDIDMHTASKKADGLSGWLPIGNLPNNPFKGVYRGNGHIIQRLWIDRPYSAGVGLFGYVESAVFEDVHIVNPDVRGTFAVGSLVGSTVTAGDIRCASEFNRCTTQFGSVVCNDGSVAVGGLIGEIDKGAVCTIDSCFNNHTTVTGSYGVGGLVGNAALFSSTLIQNCENKASITSHYSGAGGLIGVADTLVVMNSTNCGVIEGATKYSSGDTKNSGFGAGGLAGGTGMSSIYASNNTGAVSGYTGVGGLVGSTRLDGEQGMYNNCMVKSSYNTADITGNTAVGGICGEAQFGCCSVYNTGTVTATGSDSHIGGIVGNTSIAVIHNTINSGKVVDSDSHSAGGLVGKTTWGSIYASQNFGAIDVTADYAGGIVGLAGNYTVIDYCQNTGALTNAGTGPTGGIVGEIGDPREWSALDIANCVIGGAEMVLGLAGPMMAVTGKAIEGSIKAAEAAGKAISAGWKAAETLHHVLHIVEFSLDLSTIIYDVSVRFYTIYEFYNPEGYDAHIAQLKSDTEDNIKAVDDAMALMRSGYTFNSTGFSSSLSADALSPYMGYVSDVATYGQLSDDNSSTVNYNLNNSREERAEIVESDKRTGEIAHRVVSGVCLVVSAASFVASIFTGGSTLGIAVLAAGAVATTIGGANAIAETCTDYKANIVVVSQCANLGTIKADNADRVGGIAGHFQQYCYMADCLNAGYYSGTSDNNSGIVDCADCRSEVSRCLNVGANWGSAICGEQHTDCIISNNYCFDELYPGYDNNNYSMMSLSLAELCKKSSYHSWVFSGDLSPWYLNETSKYFPIPYKSLMHEPIPTTNE